MSQSPKTIEYIRHRVEVSLPEQIEQATQILGRITLEAMGQLPLWTEEQ